MCKDIDFIRLKKYRNKLTMKIKCLNLKTVKTVPNKGSYLILNWINPIENGNE